MPKPKPTLSDAAAREVIEALTDWLVDDDGARWRQDIDGADFVEAMTRALDQYRHAAGLPPLEDS